MIWKYLDLGTVLSTLIVTHIWMGDVGYFTIQILETRSARFTKQERSLKNVRKNNTSSKERNHNIA